MDRSLAVAAGLAVEPVLVAEDMAAFAAVAGTVASIVAAVAVALVLALAVGRLEVAGMVEAAAYLAAEPVEVEADAANRQIVGLSFAGRLAAGPGSAVSVAAGLLVGLVSAADMNS